LCQYRCLLQAPSARHSQISFDRRVRLDECYIFYWYSSLDDNTKHTHTHGMTGPPKSKLMGKEIVFKNDIT
jgi:hypothetical protein